MDEAVSFISTHERTISDLVDEGFGVPGEGALLTYRDLTRDRSVSLLFPSLASARRRADALLQSGRARRRDVQVLPLQDALR